MGILSCISYKSFAGSSDQGISDWWTLANKLIVVAFIRYKALQPRNNKARQIPGLRDLFHSKIQEYSCL